MKAIGYFIIGMISLSTILVSCADDLVVPKYEEDDQNPDKPVGGEEPK